MVFIGITGPCLSGKQSIAKLLESNYQFRRLYLDQSAAETFSVSPTKASAGQEGISEVAKSDRFSNAEQMMSFILSHYSQNFVTIIPDELFDRVQRVFCVRPCYYLIAMDCPLSLRYQLYTRAFDNLNVSEDEVRGKFYAKEDSKLYARLYQQAGLTLCNDQYFR
jgi:hypothetical protein